MGSGKGNESNGTNLTRNVFANKSGFNLRRGFCIPRVLLGSSFADAWVEAVWSVGIDGDFSKRPTHRGVPKATLGVDKTHSSDSDVLAVGRLHHHQSNPIVSDGQHCPFLVNTVDGFCAQHIHSQRLLQMSEIGFNFPSLLIERGQFGGGIHDGVSESRHEQNLFDAIAASGDSVAEFAHLDRLG